MFLSTPPDRIKPKLLRDVKTEALLVFIRTTLEQLFIDIEKGIVSMQVGSDEDQRVVFETLSNLLEELKKTIISSHQLRTMVNMAQTNSAIMYLAKQEAPLLHYYDTIVRQIQISLKQGENWIPEQLSLALLSEWILEDNKSIEIFPYLQNIDYIGLLSKYDTARLEVKQQGDTHKANVISNMYKISTEIIERLRKTNYKVNPTRKNLKKRK